MPCYQNNAAPAGFSVSGSGVYQSEAECLEACKEGACCNGTTCSVKPQCQCNAAAGEVFRGVGEACSPNPCLIACPCCDSGPFPMFANIQLNIVFRGMLVVVPAIFPSDTQPQYADLTATSGQYYAGRPANDSCAIANPGWVFSQGFASDWDYNANPVQAAFNVNLFMTAQGDGSCRLESIVNAQIRYRREVVYPWGSAFEIRTSGSATFTSLPPYLIDPSTWQPIQFSKIPESQPCRPPLASYLGVTANINNNASEDNVYCSLAITGWQQDANPLP